MPYALSRKQRMYTGQRVAVEVHHLRDENGRTVQKEVVVHPGAVTVLPFLNDRTIVMIRNRRHAIGEVLLELPAGTLGRGEMPMNAAGRELLEETGYLAGRMRPLLAFYASPGLLTEKMYAFAAYDLEKRQAAPEEGEDIDVVETALDEAINMIHHGGIADGKTIATLLYYRHFCGG